MIVAGFGFRKGVRHSSLADALAQTGSKPDALATLAAKVHELEHYAGTLGLPLIAIDPSHASLQKTLTTSTASQTRHNTGSVAEAAALAAAGPNAQLTGPRKISNDRRASCAIAIGDD
ncbi:MAG: cobalamin biosynthesis protein [Sulfitobacter sp.]